MISTQLYKSIILITIGVLTIYFAQSIVMPILFSAMCALLIHPLVKKFENIGLNLIFSSLVVVILFALIMTAIIFWMSYEGYHIVSSLPTEGIEEIVDNPISEIDRTTSTEFSQYSDEITSLFTSTKDKLLAMIPSTLQGINSSILFLLSCPIYIFFMLINRSSIRKFYYTSFRNDKRAIANRILNQIEMVYIKYLRGLILVILIVSILTGSGLYLLGIKHAFVLGALSGLLTLVPYLGVLLSALIPLSIALLTKDSFWYAGGVIGVYAAVQFLEGNIITPKIMGNQVGVNPLMIILGIVIFGSIGGILGMLITVPVLALIKVVSFYIPGWKPLRSLLSVS